MRSDAISGMPRPAANAFQDKLLQRLAQVSAGNRFKLKVIGTRAFCGSLASPFPTINQTINHVTWITAKENPNGDHEEVSPRNKICMWPKMADLCCSRL